MKKLLHSLFVAAVVLAGVSVTSAQPTTVSLTAASASCTATTSACAFFGVQKQAAVGIQITGTFVGTVQFEQTVGIQQTGVTPTWVSLTMTPSNSAVTATSATTTGLWTAAVTADRIRIRCSAYTSGTVVVSMISTTANRGGSGSGSSGAPVDATYIVQTADGTLTNEQALGALATGLLSSTTTTGVVSAVTTSAGVAGLLSDETGSGALVFGTSPTIATPTIASFTNATHNHQAAAGGGTLAEAALALTDVATANATSGAHGFMPKLSGNAFDFALGNGTYGRTLAEGTITASTPWTFSQTWNNAAVTFYGIVLDMTDTVSGNSFPLQLKRGGAEQFSVRGDGLLASQSANFSTTVTTVDYRVLNGGTISFSNGVNFSAGFARTSTGMKSGDTSTGYVQHEAQDVRLIPNGASKPTCDATVRGTIWYTSSAGGAADAMEVCAKSSLDVYAWRAMATIP